MLSDCIIAIEKLHRRDLQMTDLVNYIKLNHPEKLNGYKGYNVDIILRLLHQSAAAAVSSASAAATSLSGRNNFSYTQNFAQKSIAGRTKPNQTIVPVASWNKNGDGTVPRLGTTIMADYIRQSDTHDEFDLLREVAHGLHYASIALLGFLVLEVSSNIDNIDSYV